MEIIEGDCGSSGDPKNTNPIRKCSKCSKTKSTFEFHKKKGGFESRCKSCVKEIKSESYKRKKRAADRHKDNRITKVLVEPYQGDPEKMRKSLEKMELLLESLVFNVLSEHLKTRERKYVSEAEK